MYSKPRTARQNQPQGIWRHLLHKTATFRLAAATAILSIHSGNQDVFGQPARVPNIVLILADDKYECCLANGENPLQIRTVFRFPGFHQTTADCDASPGIAMN
jgi:hypothetical protein